MAKVLAVFGATGTQGGSVVDFVLNDSELSKIYKLRAITRDPSSAKSKELAARGVEVAKGDVSDPSSLSSALHGAHTIFLMTAAAWEGDTELVQGKAAADAAVAAGVKYLIFSTLVSLRDLSKGTNNALPMFDAKADIEAYIRTLPLQSSFFAAGVFMENLQTQPFMNPKPDPEEPGTWVLERPSPPDELRLPWIAAVADSGKFVGAILAAPEEYAGKTLYAATRTYSLTELAEVLSKATGKKVKARQVSRQHFYDSIPVAPLIFTDGYIGFGQYGYFGPEQEERVKWSAGKARGRLTTLEEHLEQHPLILE